jgi:hypothetical protein
MLNFNAVARMRKMPLIIKLPEREGRGVAIKHKPKA